MTSGFRRPARLVVVRIDGNGSSGLGENAMMHTNNASSKRSDTPILSKMLRKAFLMTCSLV